ncbi:hypothetical protein KR222_006846 [Zaprionus bogoriensis]|nr:hypothetical protein KR222_006846 [Zaprionus bogoriensis]
MQSHMPISPRARTRCQVMFDHAQYEAIPWQTVRDSRQVWDPLDPNQRCFDPSNPMPMPPPGYENYIHGKRLLSSRTRQLLGEQVEFVQNEDYATPEPMVDSDVELREQLHFIANHDTHLSGRPSQLRVTNGSTGDGYYIRSVTKLLPGVIKKRNAIPKYQSTFPKVSYWELLRRNQEKNLIGFDGIVRM